MPCNDVWEFLILLITLPIRFCDFFYFCLLFSNFIALYCILHIKICTYAGSFPGGAHGEESASQSRRHKRCGSDSRVGKIPWKRKWQSTPVLLSGNFHGQRSLAGYSPRGCKELDTTEDIPVH